MWREGWRRQGQQNPAGSHPWPHREGPSQPQALRKEESLIRWGFLKLKNRLVILGGGGGWGVEFLQRRVVVTHCILICPVRLS